MCQGQPGTFYACVWQGCGWSRLEALPPSGCACAAWGLILVVQPGGCPECQAYVF